MKKMKCDLCDATAEGETFEEWMKALRPHYMDAHSDVMSGKSDQTEEEQKQGMEKWMVENKTRFDAVE